MKVYRQKFEEMGTEFKKPSEYKEMVEVAIRSLRTAREKLQKMSLNTDMSPEQYKRMRDEINGIMDVFNTYQWGKDRKRAHYE